MWRVLYFFFFSSIDVKLMIRGEDSPGGPFVPSGPRGPVPGAGERKLVKAVHNNSWQLTYFVHVNVTTFQTRSSLIQSGLLPPMAPFSPGGPGIPSCPWFPLGPAGPGSPGPPLLPKKRCYTSLFLSTQ